MWATALYRSGDPTRDLWQLLAFLCRYAHQPLDVLLCRPVRELRELSSAVAMLIKEERDRMHESIVGGG